MSRSGYSDDIDPWASIRWRGAVTSATRGARGQQFFRELVAALDAMPEKRLIREALVCADGMCAMGAVAAARGTDVSDVDPEDRDAVSKALNIAEALTAEVAFMNDEGEWRYDEETPEKRWVRMRKWAAEQIVGGDA